MKRQEDDVGVALIGCGTVIAVGLAVLAVNLGILYLAVKVVAFAWGAS
jgi:hypothetical protein